MRTLIRNIAATTMSAAVLSGALTAGPVQAVGASTPSVGSGNNATKGSHCWTEVDTNRSLCAESPDALAEKMYTTYGVILEERPGEDLPNQVMAPSERVKQLVKSGKLEMPAPAATASGHGSAAPRGSTWILIKGYSEKSYGGYSKTWTQALSQRPCYAPGNYSYGQIEYMHNFNFNDKMRSYQVADGCRLNVYKDTKFRGTMRGPYGNSNNLGILDLEVSSMSLRS